MTHAELSPEVRKLIDARRIERAEADLIAAERRHYAATEAVRAAEEALAEARLLLPKLLDSAVAGGKQVKPKDVAQAHHAARDALEYVRFRQQIAERLAPEVAEAKAALQEAIVEAHMELMREAMRARITAAVALDELHSRHRTFDNPVPSDALRAIAEQFAAADGLLRFAARKGALPRLGPSLGVVAAPDWRGTTEAIEHNCWRPFLPEMQDEALAA
jgi:hypothetical protein